jgi:hypothetical protein
MVTSCFAPKIVATNKLYVFFVLWNKNVDIKIHAFDAFLEEPLTVTPMIKRFCFEAN